MSELSLLLDTQLISLMCPRQNFAPPNSRILFLLDKSEVTEKEICIEDLPDAEGTSLNLQYTVIFHSLHA